jgi:hypothetical protein
VSKAVSALFETTIWLYSSKMSSAGAIAENMSQEWWELLMHGVWFTCTQKELPYECRGVYQISRI